MLEVTTKWVIEAIEKGDDKEVFNYLYKEHLPKIKKYIIRNSGDEQEAFDIFQETMIVLYRYVKLKKYNTQHEVGGFIYTVSKNLWLNRVKKINHHVSHEDYDEKGVDIQDNVLENLITDEREKTINQVLSLLGDRCKELLTNTMYYNMGMEEIKNTMGFESTNAAKTKHYKCKQRLIKLVKDNKAFKEILQNG